MNNILAAFIGSLLPTAVALLAYLGARSCKSQVKRLHIEVNGKMERLLALTSSEAFSRGELKGAKDERTHENGKEQ